MRTIVEIPEAELLQLAEISRRQRISRAEAIRRAVAAYVRGMARDETDAFGLWGDREMGSREYVDGIRDEWRERETGHRFRRTG